MSYDIILIILAVVTAAAVLFSIYRKNTNVHNNTSLNVGFRIVHFSTERTEYKETMMSIYNKIKEIVDIYNFNQLVSRDQVLFGNNVVLTGNTKYNVLGIPHISNDDAIVLNSPILAGSYYASYSGNSDAVFSYKYSKSIIEDKLVEWYKPSDYIRERNKLNNLLVEEGGTRINKSHIILHSYLFNGENAVHANYTCWFDYNGGLKSKRSIQSFINGMNYIYDYIKKHNIRYYTIAGDANILSHYWTTYLNYKFGRNNVYLSPGEENYFYTLNDESGISTPDFILISKTIAPFGVSFYMDELLFETSGQHYYLVAEIFKTDNAENNKKIIMKHKSKILAVTTIINSRIKKYPTKLLIKKADVFNLEEYDLSGSTKYLPNTDELKIEHIYKIITEGEPPNTKK